MAINADEICGCGTSARIIFVHCGNLFQPCAFTSAAGMVMAGNESVATYRRNAADCVEMAKEFLKREDKLVLLDMAQAWLRLAEITEKFGDALCGLASN